MASEPKPILDIISPTRVHDKDSFAAASKNSVVELVGVVLVHVDDTPTHIRLSVVWPPRPSACVRFNLFANQINDNVMVPELG